jgi:hypothetical protein
MRTVRMINSVGELVAGEEYELDEESADKFVLLGWAEGELSREYSEEEIAAHEETHQSVEV